MRNSRLIYIAALAFTPQLSFAQQLALNSPVEASESSKAPMSVAATTTVIKPAKEQPLTSRWLDLKAFSHSERFRSEYNFGDAHLFEGGQERSLIQGRVKLDANDRYSIGFRASTGHYFNWAYRDLPAQPKPNA